MNKKILICLAIRFDDDCDDCDDDKIDFGGDRSYSNNIEQYQDNDYYDDYYLKNLYGRETKKKKKKLLNDIHGKKMKIYLGKQR
ncbi:hypothetical protein DERP_010504 [Dermatophagoides pteronyssinus]|uniref:Uncharacterized protein n=1 Tax=Dermatophagoides pteronyssinus TaxID=6956 RepID=A0ABQ8JG12_DERPT|nr:hypothetical protein DERP_010504 [Dermatophagoides pteronyssinus]